MDRKIEIERMEAAFKRAAEKALYGTREERSGRFELGNDVPRIQGDAHDSKSLQEITVGSQRRQKM